MSNQSKHTNCLLCHSDAISPLAGYPSTCLSKCSNCGFVFCVNIPSTETLVDYYGNSYERTSYLSPITINRFNELLDRFEKFKKTGKLLDIGAGYGFFLEIARQRGWEVHGIELTDEAVEHCRAKGITMYKGSIQDVELDPEMFDVIVSIEVIEHVNTPHEYIEQANKFLRKGGKFYLTTPNFNSLLRYRLKEKYDVIEYPNHLCYYTKKTLKRIFETHNFETERISTTGISLTRLRTSKGKSNQAYVSETSDDEMLRHRIEKNKGLRFFKTLTNGVLNLLNVGDSLKASFIKK